MIVYLRRITAVLLLLAGPSAAAGAGGLLCGHEVAPVEQAARTAHAHDTAGTNAAAHEHGAPSNHGELPDCPVQSGSTGCATAAPLPAELTAELTAPTSVIGRLPGTEDEPHNDCLSSIFHPPRG